MNKYGLRTPGRSRQSESTPTPARSKRSAMSDPGGYIRGLDGLRAIAVAAVILYHVFPGAVPGGFLGVDVFFVISGFLITTLLLREDRANNYIDLKGFWQRRIRRLLPALVALVITVVPAALATHRDLLVGTPRQVLGALTFSTNWLEIIHGSSYFDQTTPNLFKNLWSLAIEEQFYLVWPLIILVVLALIPGWRVRVGIAIALSLISATLMAVLYNGTNQTNLYYGTHTHAFGILIGVGLAFLWSDRKATVLGHVHWRRYSSWYGWAALALLVVFMALMPDTGAFAYRGGMFCASLATAVIIAAMIAPGSRMATLGEARIFHWLGTRSYGLYLWHWPALVIASVLFPAAVGSAQYLVRSLIALVITGIICELSYRFIETPVRKNGIRASLRAYRNAVVDTTGGKIAAGIVAVLAVATVVGLIVAPAKSQTQLMIERHEAETAKAAEQQAQPADDDAILPPPKEISPTLDTSMPPWEQVTAIGDSMVVASKTGLEAAMPGMNFHAKSNLQWADALDVVNNALAEDSIGRVVIVHFGTNAGVPDADDVYRVIQKLGQERIILLVNLYSPSTFIDDSNDVLAKIAGEYPNVRLVDWHKAASENPDLLQVDQTHTSIEGANYYGNLMAESIAEFTTELSAQKAGKEQAQGAESSGDSPAEG
ncbi:acyltransferase family protein [Trueperella bialowiezensis]|uniref:O-acetyltransferase OatA n=1 Tax=Trueperella bialowiezensis TaxID=312285 RepID=A0A3S4V9T9_9ACTO|nr:acyltransferase family protein [Trueperella bialowiezensis]VEI12774.1 O-acetyltransferase OatA [Trueperella bialowiezensis]